MKKILICTLYNSCNFGAFLQAFALQEFLKLNNYKVFFFENNSNIKTEKKNFILRKDIRKIPLNFKQYNKFKNNWTIFETTNTHNSNIIIIGSDELWNIKNPSFEHIKEYFGYNFKSNSIISYAPSCNKVTSDELKKFDDSINFDNFKFISVRDGFTQNLVYNYTKKTVPIVLDPTFLLETYSKYEKEVNISGDYILVYGYNFDSAAKKEIKKIAKKKNLKLIAIGLQQMWCDKNVAADSFEFLYYVKNAKYIITETFHGTIFSILYKKQFVNLSQNKNKVNYLLETFNLIDRRIEKLDNLEIIMDKKIDYDSVYEIIERERKKSKEWLLSSIEDDKSKK